jgi:hypothetical protein
VKSYQYPTAVREHSKAKGVAKFVLLTLATYADDQGECFPSYAELVRATGLSLRSVQRGLKEISSCELLIVERGRAVGHSTRYRILPDCSQADHSQKGDCSQADQRTMAKNDMNCSQADHLTTHKPSIELPIARKRAFGPASLSADKTAEPPIPAELQTQPFLETWPKYDIYRRQGKAKREWTFHAKEMALKGCQKLGPARAVAAIEHSMANGWTGIFEPRTTDQKPKPGPSSERLKAHGSL